MAVILYDLFWVYPDPTPENWKANVPIECNDGLSHSKLDSGERGIPGAILYPATLTPGIFVKGADSMIELILLFKQDMSLGDDKLLERINCQLKVAHKIDTLKSFVPAPLFLDGDISKLITIDTKRDLDSSPIRTGKDAKGRFRGLIERHVVELYQNHKFTKLVCISIHPSMFDSLQRQPVRKSANLEKHGRIIFRSEGKSDNQDYLIANALKNSKLEDNGGMYGFRANNEDVHVGIYDPHLPVQTYHPLFYLDKLAYANIGHLSDVHVSARQQALRRGKAKVIEHPDCPASPGPHVNISSARTSEILTAFGKTDEVDLVVLGGDLIDHLPNAYEKSMYWTTPPSAQDLWDFVGLDGKWEKKYVKGVDFLSVYSVIIHFYKHHPKPIFVITGNHDYYAHPFGISPRKFAKEAGKRANEGIPADHNLTMYEAILLFGPDYHRVYPSTTSPFEGDEGKWFYYYFTPFSDYSVELPNQHLLALAWGENETVVEAEGQGLGHLPRATTAITSDQLHLVDEVLQDKGQKKAILTTHFTFVSYEENLPNNHTGIVKMIDSGTRTVQDKFTRRDMGTFEHMRRRLYKELLWDQKAIQLVLTGHSHRRGLYRLTNFNTAKSQNDETVDTRHYDVRECGPGGLSSLPDLSEKPLPPCIVLSDSGGPVPRFNRSGEFYGYGSDRPGGTTILFDQSGEIQQIKVQETTLVPRFVVALDYMDIIAVEKKYCQKVIAGFATRIEELDGKEKERDKLWTFRLQFNHNTAFNSIGYKLPVSKVVLYFTDKLDNPGNQVTESIELITKDDGVDPVFGPWSEWMVPPGEDRDKFVKRFEGKKDRTTFAAIYFAKPDGITELARYDFDSPWTIEIRVTAELPFASSKTQKYYLISRVNEEFPDLDTRGGWAGYRKL